MKRPIKFRGRYSDCDLTFYSDLKHISFVRPVDEDSIVQLVGYDKDGREVYEGDTVISDQGYEYVAEFRDYPPLNTLKLKQEDSK